MTLVPIAQERHSVASRETNVFFASDAGDKEHAPLRMLERLRRGFHVFFIGRGRHSFSRLRGIEAQAVPDFDPAEADALQRRCDRRRVFRGELEVDEVGPIAKRHFENVGNHVECSHDQPLAQLYCDTTLARYRSSAKR